MKWKLSVSCFLLTISMLGSPAFAGPGGRQKPRDAVDKMVREGWKPVAPGVMQRQKGPNRVETFAIGPEGMRWALRQTRARLRFLESEYQTYPSADLLRTIQSLRQEIAKFKHDVESTEATADEPLSDGLEKNGCSTSYSASADAYSLTSLQGVAASASATFNTTCTLSTVSPPDTNAHAYSRATRGTLFEGIVQDDPQTGNGIHSTAFSSVPGGPDCYSEAYSHVRYNSGSESIFRSEADTNTLCPAITGPSKVTFSPTDGCLSTTWSLSSPGGMPPYSYTWSVDGVQVGSDVSYTRQVCPSDANFTLTATITDGTPTSNPTPQSATQTLAVTIDPPLTLDPIVGPSSVSFTSSAAATACVSKTWSTSASGGTAPYSYTWSINGVQVGTGASYTRQVCPSTTGNFTFTVTATDSSSPQQSAARSLGVTVMITPALTLAAISEPVSVSFASSTAACVSRTWSASASGGTVPYSYTWSIGGIQVGTGTSYTRQVCPSDASFTLTATVTDNSSPQQSATRTRAITVTVTPLSLATISGPTSVSFTSSTAACESKTWSTSASGGTAPYSYLWSIGGTQVGTGTSYTRQVCPSTASFTLTLTATDSSSPQQSGTRTQGVTVTIDTPLALATISGPTSVSFTSSSAACESKTWSTSASGGKAPYSYKWSISGTQVGTGTSYTRQVCPTTGNFTLTATVTDSTTPTAQSATRNRAVTVTVTEPPTVTITGPVLVSFASYASSCVTKTWTSSVSGGVSPYTYQWKIGTMSVGTGTSYSRSVCPSDNGGFTLTLTVTGSNGQSGSDTHLVSPYVQEDDCTSGGTGTTPLTICR